MKKLLRLSKMLLVAVGLLAGVNEALADVTPFSESYSSTSTTTGWKTATTSRFTPVILSEGDNYFLSVKQNERNNNGTTVTGTIFSGKAAAGDDFTLMFDMRFGCCNGQATQGSGIVIKDAAGSGSIFSLTPTKDNTTEWYINGSTTKVTLPNSGTDGATDGTAIAGITWISYKISRSGSLTYLTITNKETSEVIFARQTVDASTTGGLGDIVYTTKRYNGNFAIDNIVLRELESGDVPAVTPVNYTIKYRDESDNKIADDIVTASYVGAEITASSAQMAAITVDGQKYIYKSGNANLTLVDDEASNVITLVYRAAATYSYTINAVDGENNVLKVLDSGSVFEGDVVESAYPLYVNNDGTLYTKAATSQQYYINETIDSNAKVINYNYTATDINNVVFLTEGEDIIGASVVSTGNAKIRSSNAAAGYAEESDLKLVTLPAGNYYISGIGSFPTKGVRTIAISDGSTNVLEITGAEGSGNNWLAGNNTFTLTKTTTLYLAKGGDKNTALDFVYIQKAAPFAKIGEEGWATLYTDKALDFSGVEGLTAYTAKLSGNTVTLTQVNNVPAETGVVLKGAKNTYSIPVIASSTTDKGDLQGSTTDATNVEVDGWTFYVLAMNGENEAQFQKASSGSILAGKAYLKVASGGAPALDVVFGDATGIEAVKKAETVADGAYYNLAGQRVAQPTKGLYIVNGKKVVIK